jgi:phosphoserine phosphatase
VHIINGRATDRLIRVPTGAGKARVIEKVIGRQPDAVFGNTVHDQAMLELARSAYAIAPTDELRRVAVENLWTIYEPAPR